jgi:hypothetical protein
MTNLKLTEDMKIIDIDRYNRLVGYLFPREDGSIYFQKAPFTTKLSVEEEIQICFIVDELNQSVYDGV